MQHAGEPAAAFFRRGRRFLRGKTSRQRESRDGKSKRTAHERLITKRLQILSNPLSIRHENRPPRRSVRPERNGHYGGENAFDPARPRGSEPKRRTHVLYKTAVVRPGRNHREGPYPVGKRCDRVANLSRSGRNE